MSSRKKQYDKMMYTLHILYTFASGEDKDAIGKALYILNRLEDYAITNWDYLTKEVEVDETDD